MNVNEVLARIPQGYSEVWFEGRKYGMTRSDFNQGKSLKVYAEELGGTDVISFNYYRTNRANLLKPCEMPEARVLAFLEGFSVKT